MKLITAVIKPFKLDAVREALTNIGIHGMTVTEVKGYGRQKGHMEIYRGAEYAVNFLPKLRVEVAVSSEQADRATEALTSAARPARSATARSSSCRSSRSSGFAPARRTPTPSSPLPTLRAGRNTKASEIMDSFGLARAGNLAGPLPVYFLGNLV